MVLAPDASVCIKKEDFFTLKIYAVPLSKEEYRHNLLGHLLKFFEIEHDLEIFLKVMAYVKNVSTWIWVYMGLLCGCTAE